MKIRRISSILLVSVLVLCSCGKGKIYDEALLTLDRAIANKQETIRQKTTVTDSLKREYRTAGDCFSRYAICKKLYQEYSRFDVDSALVYAHLKEQCAHESGDRDLVFEAEWDLAYRYMVSGAYTAALDKIESIDTTSLATEQEFNYYDILRRIYFGLYQTNKDPELKREYLEKSQNNIKNTDEASIAMDEGNAELARQIIMGNYQSGIITDEASLHYWLAKTYRSEGDRDNEILHYAISANYDLCSHNVSRSLIRLARLLYKKGDTVRAFRYLLAAHENAAKSDARIAMEEVNSFLPTVISSYENLKGGQSKLMFAALMLLLLFILLLGAFLIKTTADRARIQKMQDEIQKDNQRVNEMNVMLEQRLAEIREANEIKNVYIGRYMSMFSTHIDSLEKYRSSLRNVAKSQDISEIQKALRSDEPIDKERNALYDEFDETFLAIFPDFVSQLNSLLKEECRIGQNLKPDKLTNELRIFALMRLGISNPATIAQFLKKSPSTIYNYRVKLRNSAKADRDDFESQIMKIGNIG